MDGQTFDNLARTLATGTSRRRALRWLGGLGAGVFALAGTREASAACTSFILAGGPRRSDPICVDDHLTVRVDGALVYKDPDRIAGCIGPISFTGAAGQSLQILARDYEKHCRSLSPLYLYCSGVRGKRRLTNGYARECYSDTMWRAGVFFNRTFTI